MMLPLSDQRLLDHFRQHHRATGGTQQALGTWPQLPNDSDPRYAIGDIAIQPVPGASSAFFTGLATLMSMCRVRRRRGSD